jgi:hypothetical protein
MISNHLIIVYPMLKLHINTIKKVMLSKSIDKKFKVHDIDLQSIKYLYYFSMNELQKLFIFIFSPINVDINKKPSFSIISI